MASTRDRLSRHAELASHRVDSFVIGFDLEYLKAREFVGTRFNFVIRADSPIRRVWDVIFAILISYIATIWLYRLCFIEMHYDVSLQPHVVFETIELVIDVFFWVDLFANFFFSYEDQFGHEVCNFKMIVINYLCGYFVLNLIACLPPELLALLIRTSTAVEKSAFNSVARLARLQRASKLARFARLGRLAKLASFKNRLMHILAPDWQMTPDAIRVRALRVINLGFSLLWTVHLLACGWQLCAVFSVDVSTTWLGRRDILDAKPLMQWANAFYFILTVFTTVGFGDMYPVSTGEIGYVCLCMLIGAVVHSILISEVISVVTQVDKSHVCIQANIDLVEAFANHASLDQATSTLLQEWVASHAAGWAKDDYDVGGMTTLVSRRHMPAWLLDQTSSNMFDGVLCKSDLLRPFSGIGQTPQAKVSMTIALAAFRNTYNQTDIVYRRFDKPVSLYCVLSGTFAYVGTPDSAGGTDHPALLDHAIVANTQTLRRGASNKLHVEDAFSPGTRMGCTGGAVSPYMTFSRGACFGLIETILSVTERHCTVSVESEMAEALSVPHVAFSALTEDFPDVSKVVKSAARFAELVRLSRLARLTAPVTYLELAAISIQRFWRCRGMVEERESPRRALQHGEARDGGVVNLGAHNEESKIISLMEEVKQLRDAVTSVESKVQVGLRELPSRIVIDLLSKLKRSETTAL